MASRWMEQKLVLIANYKKRQKLGPNVTLNGDMVKPYDASQAASKDRRCGLPLKFEGGEPKRFKQTWKHASGCVMGHEARAVKIQRAAMREEFLRSLRGE